MDLNFEQAATECLINRTDDYKLSVNAIDNYEKSLPTDKFILLLNYFFEISNNYDLLTYLLKKINKYKNKASVPILTEALIMQDKYKSKLFDEDSRTSIRVNITKVLANIRDNSAVNPLLYCLNNKNENYKLRLSCAEALGKIGDKYAVTPLTAVLKDDSEHSVYLKESAALALGMIGDMKAVEPLVHILEVNKGILNKFSFLKERAIEALAKINFHSNKVFNALKNVLNDESEQVRINAVEALANLDDNRVPDVLYFCLSDKSENVLRTVIISLYNISGDKILNDILNDYSLPEQTIKTVKDIIKELDEYDENEDNI